MAHDKELLIKTAEKLEALAKAQLDRGLEFAIIAGGDPSSALADFVTAGALHGAAQLARDLAEAD